MQDNIDSRLDALHQISRKKLAEILARIPGKKDLIIDTVLMKPLECITGVSFLRYCIVQSCMIFSCSIGNLNYTVK